MARSYKRDKIGRFASGGGVSGTGGRIGRNVAYSNRGASVSPSLGDKSMGKSARRATRTVAGAKGSVTINKSDGPSRKSTRGHNKIDAVKNRALASSGGSARKAIGGAGTSSTVRNSGGGTTSFQPKKPYRKLGENATNLGSKQTPKQSRLTERVGNQRRNDALAGSASSGSTSARKLTGSSRSLNKTPLSAGKKPKKDTFARIPDLKSDPSADARIRAKAAERKAAEKARSDRSVADVKKYRMVGYRK